MVKEKLSDKFKVGQTIKWNLPERIVKLGQAWVVRTTEEKE